MIDLIKEFFKWCENNKIIGLDILRIYLGCALLFRGIIFLIHPEIIESYIKEIGSVYTFMAIAHYVAVAHLAGGILLAVGLLTRLSALIQLPALAGAVFYVNISKGLLTTDSLELSALVLVMLIVIASFGAGPLSVDHYLEKTPE